MRAGHRLLRDLLTEYTLEVSSPGIDRPLTKPEHFRRFIGHRVRVRTREKLEGRSNFTGRIAGADESAVEVDLAEGAVTIPMSGSAVPTSCRIPRKEQHREQGDRRRHQGARAGEGDRG